MESTGLASPIRTGLRVVAIIAGGMLMIVPAYINQALFGRLKLTVPVSLAVSLQLFALGIVLFVIAIGPRRLQSNPRSPS